MARQRLTWRAKEAGHDKKADPNSLGRPDRQNPPVEKYMNYDFSVNHPYPDLRHQWQTDKRDVTGHPAPLEEYNAKTAAYLTKKAQVALKLAEADLPKASEDEQVAQALDYMGMTDEALISTFERRMEEEEEVVEEKPETTEEEEVVEEKPETTEEEEVVEAKPEATEEEEPAEEPVLEAEVELEVPEEEPEVAPEVDDMVDQEAVESIMAIAGDANQETALEVLRQMVETLDEAGLQECIAACNAKLEVEEPAEAEAEGLEEMLEEQPEGEEVEAEAELELPEEEENTMGFEGIDLNPVEAMSIADETVMTEEDEELLSQLFNTEKNSSVQNIVKKTASAKRNPALKKKGAQSLGGVRKKASKGNAVNEIGKLAGLWKTDPDVGHIFD